MWHTFENMPDEGRVIFVLESDIADEREVNPETDNPGDIEKDGLVKIHMVSGFVGMARDVGFGVAIYRSNGRDPCAEQLSNWDHRGLKESGRWCYVADLVRASNIADALIGDVLTEQDTDAGHIRGEVYAPK